MREFLSLIPRAFGLDFSDRSLTLCMLNANGNNVASFGEVDVPQGVVENGEVKNVEELGRTIRKGVLAIQGEPLARYCVGALPDEKAFVQVIQLPTISANREEIRSVIAFQAENYIPYPIDTVYFDFEILPSFGAHIDHTDVLVAAVPKTIVEPYVLAARQAGITLALLELKSFSLCRALIQREFSPVPVLVLDVNTARTGFIVFFGSSVRFTASIGISAESCANPSAIADLAKQVRQYLLYYDSHTPHMHAKHSLRSIQAMILCGGGSAREEIAKFLSSELRISVRVGNPWINIHWPFAEELPPFSYEDSLRYAAALGLALKASRLKSFL